MISVSEKKMCSGCFACYNACPVDCIQMKQDEEGFYYPVIDDNKCIKCEKCEKICPVLNKATIDENIEKVYICQNRSEMIRLDSTSGGAFSALAQYVLDRNGIVFGAEFGKGFLIQHGHSENIDELGRFRGSKYVQSNIGYSYKEVEQYLKAGKWVLFSGTPCQVAGLNSFLGKQYEKLIMMDLVCYSIASPGVWMKFLNHLEQKGKIKLCDISRIKFRDKSKYGYDYTLMTFYGKHGEVLLSEGPESNQMLRSFVSNASTRPSCYECHFKGIERVSDFTVWDCYNIYQYDKKMDDDKGSSHLMIHSVKGMSLLNELSKYLILNEVDANRAIKSEPAMMECSKPSEKRDAFFREYNSSKDVFDVYFIDSFRIKVERILRRSLSRVGIYKYVKRILKN